MSVPFYTIPFFRLSTLADMTSLEGRSGIYGNGGIVGRGGIFGSRFSPYAIFFLEGSM
jgi:hypothetical protein